MKNPVALIIFRRPQLTQRVFEAVREARPPRLLVVADGPRTPEEASVCEQTRAIVGQVDWPCEVETNFSPVNLGLRARMASGLDWVFERCETAIILEDDILADASFFRFCDEMLERYADNERVMQVSGFNTLGKWKDDAQSYHFSREEGVWGWASWRRAWRHFDVDMKEWSEPANRERVRRNYGDQKWFQARAHSFDAMNHGLNAWSYAFLFQIILRDGLSVVPSRSLTSNIGFAPDAVHTVDPDSPMANTPIYSLDFPLRPRPVVEVDRDYDRALLAFNRKIEPVLPLRARVSQMLPPSLKTKLKSLLGR